MKLLPCSFPLWSFCPGNWWKVTDSSHIPGTRVTRACIHADTASFYRIGGKVLSVLLKLYFASPQEFLSLTVSRINGPIWLNLGIFLLSMSLAAKHFSRRISMMAECQWVIHTLPNFQSSKQLRHQSPDNSTFVLLQSWL